VFYTTKDTEIVLHILVIFRCEIFQKSE